MITVDYPRLRMRGQVEEMPAEGLVLVNWDTGGSTRISVNELRLVPVSVCKCGHDLGSHPPDSDRPFAWPCRECDCGEYDEVETS